MKKYSLGFVLAVFLMGSLCGCGKEQKDTYMEGTDYQYMYEDLERLFPNQAKGAKGYYMLNGKFIYYIDKEDNIVTPLCNKPNCLHNKETQEERYQSCNGYVDNNGTTGIGYCNGYIYYVICNWETDNQYQLYRVKEDGSVKEKIYQWDNSTIKQWIVHRNKFYYVEVTYTTQENGEVAEHYSVKELNLKNPVHGKEKVIYQPEENLVIQDIAWPAAYGNHFYFDVFAYRESKEDITDENYLEYLYMKTFEYDLSKKQIHEIEAPDNGFVQKVTFYQDKLLILPWNPEKQTGEQQSCYITELDGSNSKVFMEDTLEGENLFWDGAYLYVGNSGMISEENNIQQNYKVYNENLEQIDEIATPYAGTGDPAIGDRFGMFLVFSGENEDEWTIEYFDKATLGQYQGKAFSTNVIAQMEYQEFEKE